jgi:carboxyl-terminal processing protease
MRPTRTGKRLIGFILSAAISMGGAMVGGVLLDRMVLAESFSSRANGLDFKLMTEAWNIISRNYVDRQAIQPQKLTYGAIGGMVNALGDTGHSTFLSPEMLNVESQFLRGNFSGIGAQIQLKDGHIVILAPMEGSPAQKAGLHSGDIILKVNGEDITGLTVEQAVTRIIGKPGTSVALTALDPGSGQSQNYGSKCQVAAPGRLEGGAHANRRIQSRGCRRSPQSFRRDQKSAFNGRYPGSAR